MKLSDIKGDRALDVIADLIGPIANIAKDETAKELFSRSAVPEGMTANEYMLQRVTKSLPQLLHEHKADLIAILSTIEGVTAEEYQESLTLAKVITDVTDLMTDDAFAVFLA